MLAEDVRLLTVREFHQMFELGILDDEERLELLEGQIVRMAARGTGHVVVVKHLSDLWEASLGTQILVRAQDPVILSDRTAPEPDLALVVPPLTRYRDRHPTPSDIYLLVEVADTAPNKDCGLKASLYARAGIADYWVLDLNARQLHVFRQPGTEGYQSRAILENGDAIAPLAFPHAIVTVAEMLHPLL